MTIPKCSATQKRRAANNLAYPGCFFVNKLNLSTLEKQRLQENLHDIHLILKKGG